MKILKVRNKGTPAPGKFVGVYLSLQINSYLSLYALSLGITKSTIVRGEMEEWYKSKIFSTKELIRELINRIELPDSKDAEYIYFKKKLKIELKQKGISENDIKAILLALK